MSNITMPELKEANILEAYTCWLKNEKLTRKQKRLLKEIPESPRFHALKELVDFAHYRFQETESVKPRPGAKERAAERLMKTIKGEITKPEPEVLVRLGTQNPLIVHRRWATGTPMCSQVR